MKHLLQACAVCVCLSLFAVCSAQAQTAAKVAPEAKITGHKVIQINKIEGLDPKLVVVKQGTTIIWMNQSESIAEIQFTGKAVTVACKNPTHFVVDEDGSFVSDRIPQGAVASLCFVEKGTFNYVLKRGPRSNAPVPTDPKDVSGSIVVD